MTNQSLPLIIEPERVKELLENPDILIVDLSQSNVYQRIHVPGAVHVDPSELVSGIPPAPGKLPGAEKLNTLFSRIGYSKDKHIIAYDDEGGGWAGRFLWTLDVIGHERYSYLNGGIHAWHNEGHPVSSDPVSVTPTEVEISIDDQYIANLDEVLGQLDDDSTIVWDARSEEEFQGLRSGSMRRGHIPGAVNLDWLDTMDPGRNYRLLPLEALKERTDALGITADKRVITHCQTHHRSGLTYLVGKLLGLDIKAYDGSWSEWANREDTPIET